MLHCRDVVRPAAASTTQHDLPSPRRSIVAMETITSPSTTEKSTSLLTSAIGHYYMTTDSDRLINPYVAIGGGILPPRRTFYPVALKPLAIVTKAFVTFPELYVG